MQTYTTAAVARRVGVHPNTVRLYEAIGWITSPARRPNGYRVFTEMHILQLRLVQAALRVPVLQNGLRTLAIATLQHAAAMDWPGALACTNTYRARIQGELRNAETAIATARNALAQAPPPEAGTLRRAQAAQVLELSIDRLRNWEMNGLLSVKRRENGYRIYTPEDMQRLRLIRALRCANYSLAAILRMLHAYDRDPGVDLRRALDAPAPEEGMLYVCDQLLTSLRQAQQQAEQMLLLVRKLHDLFPKPNPPL